MKNILRAVTIGSITIAVLLKCPLTGWSSDNPPIPSVPGNTAVSAPTPQPPVPETSMSKATPSVPRSLERDSHGVPTLVVEFELDHSDIPPAFYPHLNAFGDYLRKHPAGTATLTGHADNSGHGPANGTLSQKRADAVAAYLISHYGIDASRIQAQGAGAISDKSNNSTGAARQADRRVYGTIKMAD